MRPELRRPARTPSSRGLVRALRRKSADLAAHSRRMSALCACLGEAYGLPPERTRLLSEAAPLHDIGKLVIPDRILEQRRPLTRGEWEIVKLHTSLGARMLAGSSSRLLRAAAGIALSHHERWDGSGYPHALRGEEIPLFARLVTVVDQYDALRSERPYKRAVGHDRACAILLEGDERTRPRHFDPAVLGAFERVQDRFEALFARAEEPAVLGLAA